MSIGFGMKATAVSLTVAASLFAFCGCSSSDTQDESASQDVPVVEDEKLLVIGAESDDALTMEFANDTGKDIAGFAVRQSGNADAQYSDNMLSEGVWAAGDAAQVYCEPFDAQGSTSDGAEIALKPAYDIQLTFADQTTAVLHSVTFEEADSVSVLIDAESGLAYLAYDQDGAEASTLEAERAIQQQAEAEAAAAARAQAEAEAQAAAEADAAAAAAEDPAPTYDYSYDYSYAETSSNGGSADSGSSNASQSEDSCMGGQLQLR